MKKTRLFIIVLICIFGMVGCSKNTEEAHIVNTFEENITYNQMSDDTWETDNYTYQYKLVITGRLNNAGKDSTYTILSNTEGITFEQAWKASGLSSHSEDYFKAEEAIIVNID